MKLTRSATIMAVLLVMLMAGMAGWFRPLDELARSIRFSFSSRPVTGQIAFADIDAKSVQQIGVWPWPRRVHAQVIDRLMAAGARDVSFDVDFSAASNPADDKALEDALADAGGYVILSTFSQPADNASGRIINMPLPRFAQYADMAAVNIPVDADGLVRSYATSFNYGDVHLATLGAALVLGPSPEPRSFRLDYGIDVTGIDRVSIVDILSGNFDPAVFANKHVVVGASALELRDTMAVPRFGTLPGALIHVLAAETLMQNRALSQLPVFTSVLVALLLAGTLTVSLRRHSEWLVLVGGATALGVLELLAFWLQYRYAISLDTMVVHASVIGVGFVGVSYELAEKGIVIDRTARAHARTRSVLDRVITDNFDGVLVINAEEEVTLASRMAEALLAKEGVSSVVGQSISRLLPVEIVDEIRNSLGKGPDTAEAQLRQFRLPDHGQGQRIVEYVITLTELAGEDDLPDRANRIACMTFRDVTDRHRAEQKLTYLATHDPLTGAYSRAQLVAEMRKALQGTGRNIEGQPPALRSTSGGVTLALIDLSRFKQVNDTLGHSYGDMLLRVAANRLHKLGVGAVARLGGDNFAVMSSPRLGVEKARGLAQAILETITASYQLDEHRAIVGAKIGIADAGSGLADPELLIAHADMALSQAKGQPGSSYAFFTEELDDRLRETQTMELALRQAIAEGQLWVAYQPQVSLADGRLIGVEALVRWQHPELGAVPPGRFIPIAEETGIILELGNWVLRQACREAASWPVPIKLAVNVSPLQFEFDDVPGQVRNTLAETGLTQNRLDIEVTESTLVSNSGLIIDKLNELRELGIGIALDDFGTGYSSLSYLGRLPIDKIKIDQSFVRGLPGSDEAGAIVRAIMTLSESLGKTVVAEGIENADQAWMLRLAGCHVGQGYHYGRPMAGAELAEKLRALGNETALPKTG